MSMYVNITYRRGEVSTLVLYIYYSFLSFCFFITLNLVVITFTLLFHNDLYLRNSVTQYVLIVT